jgi:DNA-binding SARP family transcriptional activator
MTEGSPMEFKVLGQLEVVSDSGTRIPTVSGTQRRLLSLLLSRAGTTVSADFLADRLELSAGALRTSISRVRRVVGSDVLATVSPGYELRSISIDSKRFENLLASARSSDDQRTSRMHLEEAVSLWRGKAFEEFALEDWAITEATRLSELWAGAVEDLGELLIAAKDWTRAIVVLESLIVAQPFRDRPRGLLMRALADSGRRTDALRSFQEYRRLLLEEVGTEPSAAVTALDRLIAAETTDHTCALDAPPGVTNGPSHLTQCSRLVRNAPVHSMRFEASWRRDFHVRIAPATGRCRARRE